MRPRSNRSTVPAHGLVATLLLLLAAEPAWAQHGGHTGGFAGSTGTGHHLGAGPVAGTQHHGGATTYGYGGGYLGGYGYGLGGGYPASYGYGSLYSPYSTGYAPAAVASLAGYGGAMFPGVGPLVPAAIAQHPPLHFSGIAPPFDASAPDTSASKSRPADNAGHFELILPFEAEVFVNGARTSQTGFIRHYNTPKLTPGYTYHYQVRVRYMNAQRDMVEDTRDIEFKANDWFRVDFTRLPAPKAITSR